MILNLQMEEHKVHPTVDFSWDKSICKMVISMKGCCKPGASHTSFPEVVWGIKWLKALSPSSLAGGWWTTSLVSVSSARKLLLLLRDRFFTCPVKVTKGEGSCASSLAKGTLSAMSVEARTCGSFTIILSCLSLKLRLSGELPEPEMSTDKCAWLLVMFSPLTLKSFKRPLGRLPWECTLRLDEWCNARCECTLVVPASASDPLEVWRPVNTIAGSSVKSFGRWEQEKSW